MNGDVVAAALRLVGTVGVDVVAVAGVDVHVIASPRILVHLLEVLGHQLREAVRPLTRFDVIEVNAVGNGLEIESGRSLLCPLQVAEDVEADGPGDEPEDDQHHHDLDQRHAPRRS